MKIKEYVLTIIVSEEGDEIIHLSERYDCEEAKSKFRLEVEGDVIDAPDDMQESLNQLDTGDILGVA